MRDLCWYFLNKNTCYRRNECNYSHNPERIKIARKNMTFECANGISCQYKCSGRHSNVIHIKETSIFSNKRKYEHTEDKNIDKNSKYPKDEKYIASSDSSYSTGKTEKYFEENYDLKYELRTNKKLYEKLFQEYTDCQLTNHKLSSVNSQILDFSRNFIQFYETSSFGYLKIFCELFEDNEAKEKLLNDLNHLHCFVENLKGV